ncbi:hypothetical protein GALMADRAFT_60662 [Galerina marginata CBS 339.88]|uniref:PD-(D/E)XK endonuclease-like domain-containing protein n=1 Tax=Galerina marginata (strain CBS 339.88) TaxID=685588 RepID=A0A067TDA0_GALM3|nr:hypothetical protein GALMADRAFT_60662 [Galerina marginata CBS 339.88]
MTARPYLTATSLAAYQHFNCGLYIHNTYHTTTEAISNPHVGKSDYLFKRGIEWEKTLFTWLENSGLLLRIPAFPLDPAILIEKILADDRTHFFIAGITFLSPQTELDKRFIENDVTRIRFGTGKPDLIEITRKDNKIFWRVIDAKASKQTKTSHYIQIYFYVVCLNYIFDGTPFRPMESAAVWLPPKGAVCRCLPSLEDIKDIFISTLASVLDKVIFREIPLAIGSAAEDVYWHYGPSCQGCPYETKCRLSTREQGKLGCIPNLAKEDVEILHHFARLMKEASPSTTKPTTTNDSLTDIEELHWLIKEQGILQRASKLSPTVVEFAREILACPKKLETSEVLPYSAIVEAAKEQKIELIPRINYTCPSREDVAIVISIIRDIESVSSTGVYFCTSVHCNAASSPLQPVIFSEAKNFVKNLAALIRGFQNNMSRGSFQFYTWSTNEKSLLEKILVDAASDCSEDREDIELCIVALVQGTPLLSTNFQPILFPNVISQILSKETMSRTHYMECLLRLGISADGDTETLQKRLNRFFLRGTGNLTYRHAWEPPVVVSLKKEVERQLALPIPGYWDLPSCSSILLPATPNCPSEDEIAADYRIAGRMERCQDGLFRRNNTIYSVLICLRSRAVTQNGKSLLVNEAKPLATTSIVLCKEPTIRKLYFMQEMEVLLRLHEIQKRRMNRCDPYPSLRYLGTVQEVTEMEHAFAILSDNFDMSSTGVFYDLLLIRISPTDQETDSPVEILFDDLVFSALVIPPNSYGISKWEEQHSRVKNAISLARIRGFQPSANGHGTVHLHVWGSTELVLGGTYRLTPRLVDFNTRKTLSSLLDLDIRWATSQSTVDGPLHRNIPYLQLIYDAQSFGKVAVSAQYRKFGHSLQKRYRALKQSVGEKTAGLILKTSQYNAAQHIFANRLSIVWGPPGNKYYIPDAQFLIYIFNTYKGTGKTHTICLSILRLLETQYHYEGPRRKIIFITGVTTMAIESCQIKLCSLVERYKIANRSVSTWLKEITIEFLNNGYNHPLPLNDSRSYIYAGTIYQVSPNKYCFNLLFQNAYSYLLR